MTEIKELMKDKEFIPHKLSRNKNRVVDRLANYSRSECTTVWLHLGPSCIENLLPLDCNSQTLFSPKQKKHNPGK